MDIRKSVTGWLAKKTKPADGNLDNRPGDPSSSHRDILRGPKLS
jgi:hypothetical protein